MNYEIKTLNELSLDGKGSYGIAASAVPYSDELYTYLRITDIKDDGNLDKSNLMSVADKKAYNYTLKRMILYLQEQEQAQEGIIFMMRRMENWFMLVF